VIRRLENASAVLLGKTNMHEFALGGTSAVSYFGPVHNPWDLDRIPGGSSGKSGVATAAGLSRPRRAGTAPPTARVLFPQLGSFRFQFCRPVHDNVQRRRRFVPSHPLQHELGAVCRYVVVSISPR